MNFSEDTLNPVPFLIRKNKNLVYKTKKYQVDFGLLKMFSNFFYINRKKYKNMEDIKLKEEDVDISDEIIQEFINFCQVGQIEIDDSNVFIHRQLAYRYDVPFLKDKIKKYFSDKISQNPQYINQICLRNLFKKENQPNYQDEYNDGYEWALKDDEEIISNNFFDVINDELILELDVPIIYRILNNHILNFKEMGETKQKHVFHLIY